MVWPDGRGTVELEHHFRILSPDVRLCVVDNVIVALHPGPDGARCLLFDVDSPSADRSLSPACEPALLDCGGLHQVGPACPITPAASPGCCKRVCLHHTVVCRRMPGNRRRAQPLSDAW